MLFLQHSALLPVADVRPCHVGEALAMNPVPTFIEPGCEALVFFLDDELDREWVFFKVDDRWFHAGTIHDYNSKRAVGSLDGILIIVGR